MNILNKLFGTGVGYEIVYNPSHECDCTPKLTNYFPEPCPNHLLQMNGQNYRISKEQYSPMWNQRVLSGPREGCEDSVCSQCNGQNLGQDAYKKCKQTCIATKTDAIKECCLSQCRPTDKDCILACNTQMVFGEGADPNTFLTRENPNLGWTGNWI